MGLLDSDAGKRRLLSVEIPALELYNKHRAEDYQITVVRTASSLVLHYQLKPCHNIYVLESRLVASYPIIPPETRILTPIKQCPHILEGQTVCTWRQSSTRSKSRWNPAEHTCVFAVQAAWRWLLCYEHWYKTGEWGLPEAK